MGINVSSGFRGVKIATNLEMIMVCIAIRGHAFLAAGEPYEEEIDGLDFCGSTHLLHVSKETVNATMRIRFLHGTTCAWERVCVVPSADARVLSELISAATNYCRRKGQTQVIGAVNDAKFQKYLQRRGAVFLANKPLIFGGQKYLPMKISLDPVPSPNGDLLKIPEEVYLDPEEK